jgi:organic hydroperoxide reductase OsmC/OhrA
MGETRIHQATIVWEGGKHDIRAHAIHLAEQVLPGSCATAFGGDASKADPEELFVAALSTCHMLWFLDFARRARLRTLSYEDRPQGTLDVDAACFVAVRLRPAVEFEVDVPTTLLDELHHQAHEACFIARSARCEVIVEPALRWGQAVSSL